MKGTLCVYSLEQSSRQFFHVDINHSNYLFIQYLMFPLDFTVNIGSECFTSCITGMSRNNISMCMGLRTGKFFRPLVYCWRRNIPNHKPRRWFPKGRFLQQEVTSAQPVPNWLRLISLVNVIVTYLYDMKCSLNCFDITTFDMILHTKKQVKQVLHLSDFPLVTR